MDARRLQKSQVHPSLDGCTARVFTVFTTSESDVSIQHMGICIEHISHISAYFPKAKLL